MLSILLVLVCVLKCPKHITIELFFHRWSKEAFKPSATAASFFVDGGMANDYLNQTYTGLLSAVVFSRFFPLRLDYDRPVRMLFEDAEHGESEEISISREDRQLTSLREEEIAKRQQLGRLVRGAINRRSEGRVAFGVAYSRNELEGVFKVAVSTSTAGPELVRQVEAHLKETSD